MSSGGGVFKLITNTGFQDKLIVATDRLADRMSRLELDGKKNLRVRLIKDAEASGRQLSQAQLDAEIMKSYEWRPTLEMVEQTHVLFTHSTFKPFVSFGCEYYKSQGTKGTPKLGNEFSYVINNVGDFVNDMVVRIKLTGLSAVNAGDKVRYVEFPGHKLFKRVSFIVNNITLDQYTTDDMNAYYHMKLPKDKREGYLRSIGQEVPKRGYITQNPTTDELREYRLYANGAQTFKRTQDDLEMFMPILFWFKDIHCALPNFLIAPGLTELKIQLCEASELVSFADYVGTGAYTTPQVSVCELYTNNIFMLPAVRDLFRIRFGYRLVRTHGRHIQPGVTAASGRVLLNGLKGVVETLYVGFRPTANVNNSQNWHRNSFLTRVDVEEPIVISATNSLSIGTASFYNEAQSVDTLELRSNDITIFPEAPSMFYDSYMPTQWGSNISAPEVRGWHLMNINVEPGKYQPSGHFDTSRSRENYLIYNSSQVDPNHPVDVIVLADTINFLLVKDGGAIMKFM